MGVGTACTNSPPPANLSSEVTENELGRRLLLAAYCAAFSGSGNLRPQRCGAPCAQGRLQKLKDRRGAEQGLLRAGLDAHCGYAPAPPPAIGLELQAQQSQPPDASCLPALRVSDVEPRIPLTELEVVQAGQCRVPVSLGGESPVDVYRGCLRPVSSPGSSNAEPLLLGSPVCVHMALKGMGSGGPQRWVLPCGMQRARCSLPLDTGPSPVVLTLLPVAMM